MGIAVDHRRRNHCEESLKLNCDRLKEWTGRLMIMPRKAKAKKGDTTRAEVAGATLAAPRKQGMPIVQEAKRIKARAITSAEKSTSVYKILRKARVDKKMFGRRLIRAKE